jgi:23S rRNA pseudouridine1911/1915/1917 synthase
MGKRLMATPQIPILYEDNHILVIIKPPNVPSQEDISGDPDLLTILKADIKKRYNKPGNVFLSLVHRLDRPVGGVMVLTRTSKGASRLSEQIRECKFEKTYICVVNGVPSPKKGRLEHFLEKDRNKNIVKTVKKGESAKKAVLEYETLGTSGSLSLVRVNLHTGRSHQIRVQLAEIGCPLYGDQKYGGETTKSGEQIALWSYEIAFTHPTGKHPLRFSSPPPDEKPWNLFPSSLLK